MSCNCNETTKQGKQYCQECMPSEFHWLVPVSKEPDPFLMDRNHAYIDPNNIIYVLSRDRVRAIKITTSEGNIDLSPYALKEELASKISELTTKLTEGLEGAKYFEGEGIRIDEDNRIHSTVTLTEVNQRLDSLEQVDTSPYKAGTGIEITPDLTIKSTVDVSGLDSRVQTLEEKEDKDTTYTAGAGLQLNGTEFSVNPNDLPGTDQLVDINTRVTALENNGGVGGDYRTEIITTIQPYYEDRKDLYKAEVFDTTHNLKCPILTNEYTSYTRDGIIFITVHRYINETTYDGNATITAMYDESIVSDGDLQQEHIVEMKTISAGNIKIRCELVNYGTPQEFKVYDIPNDSTESYQISVRGFNFVPQQVLVPIAPMLD